MEQLPEEVIARFEELGLLETEFEDVELTLIRQANTLNAPLYKKRADIIAKIPHFWALVFEQAPQEVDSYIQPTDSKVFADHLETVEVTRFEIDDPNGSPRSFSIKFTFSENPYFDNNTLEKKFWHRMAKDGWQGLVSEPVKINWKKGKDMTAGLTDAAYALWQAKEKLPESVDGKSKETSLPEYKKLAQKIEADEDVSNSFFTWFAFVSSYRYVTAEESVEANKAEAERLEKKKRGEDVDEPEDDDDAHDYQETEVFPTGDQLATIIAEDMWPSAIKYFKYAHEADDEDLSELEVEEMDDDDDDENEDEEMVDIRGLVGKGRKPGAGDSPPSKKPRNA